MYWRKKQLIENKINEQIERIQQKTAVGDENSKVEYVMGQEWTDCANGKPNQL
jgi:hypothetical protein